MYPEIPTILTSQELLDKALGRMSKITKDDPEPGYRVRKTVSAQLDSLKDNLLETMQKYVTRFPNLDKVSTYERELIDVVVGAGRLKKEISRLTGATAIVERILTTNLASVGRTLNVQQIKKSKSAAVGRISSVINDMEETLAFLGHARDVLRAIPER